MTTRLHTPNRSLLARLAAGLVVGASMIALPMLATAPAIAALTQPLSSVEILLSSGATWRGELGATVDVVFNDRGVEQRISGTLAKVEPLYVVVQTTIAGKPGEKLIFRSDLKEIITGTPTADSPPTGPGAGSDAEAPERAPGSVFTTAKKGVFLLPMEGTVGIGLRHQEIDEIGKHADQFGPGQIIVLQVNSPGGLVIEGDKISESLVELKKRHRVVAWIKEAISGAAFTALHCDEIYFMRVGTLGAITMFAGQTSIQGAPLQAWLDRCSEIARVGGRHPAPVRAMIHAPLMCTYDKDPVTGRVTWYDNMQGEHVLSIAGDNLVFNASNALHSGFSDGTADTVEELAVLLQLEEWHELSDYGRRIAARWLENVEAAQRDVPILFRRLTYKGTGSGDQEVYLSSQMNIVRELIRWWDRAPNVLMYEIGVAPKEELERTLRNMQKQLADMRRARRGD